MHTTDGGKNWDIETVDPYHSLLDIQFAKDKRTGWVVGIGSTIVSTQDGGKTWENRDAGIENTHAIHGLHFTDAKKGWAVAQDGGVIHTVDGGETWELQQTGTHNDLLAVYSSDSKGVWAVGTYGTILHSKDSGKSWNIESESTSEPLAGIDISPTGSG